MHWTDPEEMDFGDTPPEHLYTNGTHPYYRAPHIYLALAKRFFPTKAALAPDQARALVSHAGYRVASSDSVFFTSRGGNRYDLHFEQFAAPLVLSRGARQADLQQVVQRFADRLAHHARSAPYNWFNFYDFWQLDAPQDTAGCDPAHDPASRLGRGA